MWRVLGSGWTLAAALVLAAALRVAHVFALRRLPLFDRLLLDSEFYDAWARGIAAGDWMGGARVFFYDPLYPYFLAVVYRIAGHDLLLVRLLHVALGLGTCALTWILARRIAGRAAAGVAALIVAVYGPAIYQEGEIEKTALGVFLITACLALLAAASPATRLIAGIALGLATLARGNMLLLAPFGFLWLAIEPRASARRRGLAAGLFTAGVMLVLGPVAIRNHRVCGEWILTTAGGGTNYYTGNNPANTSGGYEAVPFVRPQSAHEEDDFRAEALRRTGRTLSPSELSRYWYRESLRHSFENPGFALRVHAKKVALFWGDLELADGWDMAFLSRASKVLALPLLGFAPLFALAVVGAWAVRKERRSLALLLGYVAVYAGTVIAFYVFSRYRLHILPALAVFAGAGVVWLAERVRDRAWRSAASAAAVAVGIGIASHAVPRTVIGPVPEGELNSAVNLAGLWMERGDLAESAKLLAETLERFPGRASVLCRIGDLGLRQGDVPSAREAFRACVAADPGYPDAWYRLGMTQEALGDLKGAASSYRRQLQVIAGHTAAAERLRGVSGGR